MDFSRLEFIIGVQFNDKELLRQLCIHRSYINENKNEEKHNERLEFLGDAVLELVTTEHLFLSFEKNEGVLTNLRSAMVKKETLASVGRDINLGDFILLSKGERSSGGNDKDYILANTVEALIGGMYLDQGYETVKKFIKRFIIVKLENIMENKSYKDSKSVFQEKAQEKLNITPEYKEIFSEGPDHNKVFTMGVYIGDEFVAQGKGPSKQIAEQDAAKVALEYKGWEK